MTAAEQEPTFLSASNRVPSPSWFKPGRSVERFAGEPMRGKILAWVPCHESQSVKVPAPEHGEDEAVYMVRCRVCEIAFLLTFHSSGGDDWTALWTVSEYIHVWQTTSRHGSLPW